MTELEKHLRTLGVSPSASFKEVKSAYRRMVREWHPDRHTDDEGMRHVAEEKIKTINISYDYLCRYFSKKRSGFREDGGRESIEPVTILPVDRSTLVMTALTPDQTFPLVFDALRDLGVENLAWDTYRKMFRGSFRGNIPGQGWEDKEMVVQLSEQGSATKLQSRFHFVRRQDNVKLGFVEGPDLAPSVAKMISRPNFQAETRQGLLKSFYQTFQLHEITFSEIVKKKVLVESGEDFVVLRAITMNQAMNLVFKAFGNAGVQEVFWNIPEGRMEGNTGWSLRSCGQRLTMSMSGRGGDIRGVLSSKALAFGGILAVGLSDLGRGREEVRKIIAHIVNQVKT